MPLDWMLHSLHRWFEAALRPFGVARSIERVEGAWCPGFSDVAVGGRKLAGLGFRVTRERVVMRGVMAVRPMSDADFDVLARCHRLIGVEVRRGDRDLAVRGRARRRASTSPPPSLPFAAWPPPRPPPGEPAPAR